MAGGQIRAEQTAGAGAAAGEGAAPGGTGCFRVMEEIQTVQKRDVGKKPYKTYSWLKAGAALPCGEDPSCVSPAPRSKVHFDRIRALSAPAWWRAVVSLHVLRDAVEL